MNACPIKTVFGTALMLAIAMTGPALAEDPREAARILGEAGQEAAGAIARDASRPARVPGYAGTNLPERNHSDATMEDAADQALSDPDNAGGAAGQTLIQGITQRPDAPFGHDDAAAQQAETIADDPQAPAWGAGALASGEAAGCGSDLDDADEGGSCGGVTWCVGADCETVEAQANTGFLYSVTKLNMATHMGEEGLEGWSLRVFTGERRACTIKWAGVANCCKNSGLLVGIIGCSANERYIAEQRHTGTTHYLGKKCTKRKWPGICKRRERAWCIFPSKLGRILHEQARPQLGMDWGLSNDCRGFTVSEIERIEFDRIDLSEFTDDILRSDRAPGVGLPDADDTGAAMRQRILERFTQAE